MPSHLETTKQPSKPTQASVKYSTRHNIESPRRFVRRITEAQKPQLDDAVSLHAMSPAREFLTPSSLG